MEFFGDTILSNWVFVYFIFYLAYPENMLGYATPNPLYLFYFIIAAYYAFLIVIAVTDPKIAPYSAVAMFGGVFTKLIPTWLILRGGGGASKRPNAGFAIGFLAAYFAWITVARNTDIFAVYRKMIRNVTDIPLRAENIPRILLVLLGVNL